jgi:low density lipoprotein receptor-related protein 5/6
MHGDGGLNRGGSRGGLRSAHRPILAGALTAFALAAASPTHAADRIYWSNFDAAKISFANLDGSGGGDLPTGTATVQEPDGVALDPAAGRIYWANVGTGANAISFANLDGSGGADLTITGTMVKTPIGVAVDPVAGKIYWGSFFDTISLAKLDGSGGAVLDTTGASLSDPQGLVVDAAAGKIYWANAAGSGGKIVFAKLDGSGGGDLSTTGATTSQAAGVALDLAAGKIYWANAAGGKISFARLDGSGGGDLTITGTTVGIPLGVALDLAAGRIYFANRSPDRISSANLDGSGGADLPTSTATLSQPAFIALLEHPSAAAPPAVTGGATVGTTLSCSNGSWAADLVTSLFYRAPHTFTFQWSLGGADVAGATESTITPSAPGDYTCRVTATNAAGSASQTSAPHPVAQPAFGVDTFVTLEVAAERIPAKGPLEVKVASANDFQVTGTLSGESVRRVGVSRKRPLTVQATPFTVAAHADTSVDLALSKPLRRLLRHKHKKWALRLTANVGDPAGNIRTVTLDTPAR